MRLINTTSLELETFIRDIPPYAILSHTWGDEEVTFDELTSLNHTTLPSTTNADVEGHSSCFFVPVDLDALTRNLPLDAVLPPTWGCDSIPHMAHVCESHKRKETNSHIKKKKGWGKITKACAHAASRGWKYIWIDTCCIDKSDLSELSEAINSMFRWY